MPNEVLPIELLQLESINASLLIFLIFVATLAGLIDAIAGGGGLLVLPVLLSVGLTPSQALATNKLQAVFGSFSASLHFFRQGLIDLGKMRLALISTFLGAALGSICIQRLPSDQLQKVIPILLISFALYFLLSPRVADTDAKPRLGLSLFSLSIASLIGFYDGFFGPGTGSFFTLAFVLLLGYNLIKATAHAKLLNFTSNLAALIFFILGGQVLWHIGLTMALGQLLGGYLGAHLVLRHGAGLIRPLLVIISLTLSLKLIFFDYG